MARAAEPVLTTLAIPMDDQLAAAAAASVDDRPLPGPEAFDSNALIDAADAAADALPPEAWEVDALAAQLGGDRDAAFAFVRDSIRYEPYAGVLRGAEGTLAARAGNAYDRALLLKALLDTMGMTTRFAFGTLDPTTAATLVAHAFDEPSAPLQDAASQALPPELAQRVATRGRRDYALLRSAVGDRIDGFGMQPDGDLLAEASRHAWVQVDQAGQWIDLDPSAPDSEPGTALVAAVDTPPTISETERQTVTLRMWAETLEAGVVTVLAPLERTVDAAAAADSQMLLYFLPDDSGGFVGGVGSPTAYIPVLVVNGVPQVGASIPVAGVGDPLLGTTSDLELVSLGLDIITQGPGLEPRQAHRIFLDRVPADARASGAVTAGQLAPMVVSGKGPSVMSEVHDLLVSTGGASPRLQAILRAWATYLAGNLSESGRAAATGMTVDIVQLPGWVADRQLVLASERAIVPAINDAPDVQGFIHRPRIYLASFGPDSAAPTELALTTDLQVDGLRVIGTAGSDPTAIAAHQLWYGALQSALKSELALGSAAIFDPSTVRLTGASFAMSQPLTVLDPSDPGATPDGSPDALAEAVRGGWLAVVPGDPVTAHVWWTISPLSGTTRSIDSPGLNNTKVGGRPAGTGGTTPGGPSGPGKVKPVQKPIKLPKNLPPKTPGYPTQDGWDGGKKQKRGAFEYGIVNALVGLSVLVAVDIGTEVLTQQAFEQMAAFST